MKFGDKLKILVEERGITQKELASHLNIAPSTVSSYVQNTREPDFITLKSIAQYFNVSIEYLLRGTEPVHQQDVLDEVDIAFYGDYSELSEDDKATLRDMARIMRERRSKKQE